MTRAAFSFRRLSQVAHDAALAGLLVGVTGIAQCAQLLFKQTKCFDLLVNTADLFVNQLVDFFTGRFRAHLKAAQGTYLRQSDTQRAAMADEVELYKMGFSVTTVTIGFPRWRVEQSFTLVKAHRFNVAATLLCQFSDSHLMPFQEVLDPVVATGYQMVASFPE